MWYFACNSKIVIVLQHSVHIKAISLMAVILRLELWNIQETSRNFLVIENPCGQRVIAEHATYHPTWFMLHIRPFTNETFSLSLTQNLGKYTQFGRSRSIYLLDAVTLSGILKAKQKLGVTFNSNKLGGIYHVRCLGGSLAINFSKNLYVKFSPKI